MCARFHNHNIYNLLSTQIIIILLTRSVQKITRLYFFKHNYLFYRLLNFCTLQRTHLAYSHFSQWSFHFAKQSQINSLKWHLRSENGVFSALILISEIRKNCKDLVLTSKEAEGRQSSDFWHKTDELTKRIFHITVLNMEVIS